MKAQLLEDTFAVEATTVRLGPADGPRPAFVYLMPRTPRNPNSSPCGRSPRQSMCRTATVVRTHAVADRSSGTAHWTKGTAKTSDEPTI